MTIPGPNGSIMRFGNMCFGANRLRDNRINRESVFREYGRNSFPKEGPCENIKHIVRPIAESDPFSIDAEVF